MSSTGPAAARIADASTTRVARACCTLVAIALFLGARPASADEPEPEVHRDATAYPAPSTRLPLFGIGLATSLVWYGGAVGGAYLYPTANGADELKIPLAGPWMSLAETGCPPTTPDCSTFWMVVGGILKGFSGIGQAGGVLLMVEGLFLPTVEPRVKSARAPWRLTPPAVTSRTWADTQATSSTRFVVLPAPLPGGGGLSVVGLF